MGKKKPKQPLARRNGDGTGGGWRDGSADSPTGDDNATIETVIKTTATEQIHPEAGRVVEGSEAVAKRYSPPGCVMCQGIRPAGNFTDVYCTRHEYGYTIRYCRCRYCGNTFKDAVKK